MDTRRIVVLASIIAFLASCAVPPEPQALAYVPIGPRELPSESYERPPEVPFDKSGYLFKFENLSSFYDVPGEAGYFMLGEDYGFDSLTIIITETHPHGGPPLHTHDVEEAHVLLSGQMDYVIGERSFSATAPYIAKVPAGVPHTFVNAGEQPLNLIGIIPSNTPGFEVVGPNPLVE